MAKPQDLYLIPYVHEIHFATFWPIFTKYWLDVNGEDLNGLITLSDGRVGNLAEEKLMDIYREGHLIKLAYIPDIGIAGFLHYRHHGNGELFIHSMYVIEPMRGFGIAGVFLKSFRGYANILFHTHIDTPPKEFLDTITDISKIGPSSNPRLCLWSGKIKE